VRRADNLTSFMCRFSWNLGASTSWNPQGVSRPVMELLGLYAEMCEIFIAQNVVMHNSTVQLNSAAVSSYNKPSWRGQTTFPFLMCLLAEIRWLVCDWILVTVLNRLAQTFADISVLIYWLHSHEMGLILKKRCVKN